MKFTDLFIRRPVLASVVSLMILIVGLRSFSSLQVLAYPRTENGLVTITTSFPGADPDSIAGFITTPIETAVAQANGIDYMTSISQNSTSTITVYLRQNYDTSKAAAEINIKVNSVLNQLPSGALQPTITVRVGQTTDAMYFAFNSTTLAANQITDYLTRVAQPILQAVPGVQTAEVLGGQTFSLRAWLDPKKLSAYGLTASDVSTALAANDYISAVGNTKGQMIQVTLTSTTNLHALEDFRNLVVKPVNGANIRLSDVADVSLGADSYEARVSFNGKTGVFIGIQIAPTANLLTVIKGCRDAFPEIQAQLPQGLIARIAYDSTDFVTESIHEVALTLVEALIIVMLVIFAFLGSPRSVLIPVIAIPLSLVGTLAVMLALGFSINLLTLLALVLAIGLVVDDAIIVVENVNRHLEAGTPPLAAAMQAARELGTPIIAMTVVLLAVYIPIGFQGGLTGALFTEFVFTVAGAVTVSAVIALTLSPMLCSKLLKPHREGHEDWETRIVKFIDARLDRFRRGYQNLLEQSLNYTAVTAVFVVLVLISIALLYRSAKSELAPQEDQSFMVTQSTYAPDAALQQRLLYASEAYGILKAQKGIQDIFQIEAPGVSIAGNILGPIAGRPGSNDIQRSVQQSLGSVAGAKIVAFQPPSLPGAFGLPVQFAIKTTEPALRLNDVSRAFLDEALKSGMFIFFDTDLKYDLPQSIIEIDRDKAAQLGLTMSQVGSSLGESARGRLRQLLQHADTLVQGHSAGATRIALEPGSIARLSDREHQLPAGAVIDHRPDPHRDRARNLESFSAVELGHAVGSAGARRIAGRCIELPAQTCGPHTAVGIYDRLCRSRASVRPGIDRRHGDVRLRHHHRVSDPGGALRKLSRSAGHPDLGPAVDCRSAHLHRHRRRRRHPEHLHPSWPRDPHRPDQQTRHLDRGSRQ